jgi:hypothetical protein
MWVLVLVPLNNNNKKIGFDFQNQFWNWNPKWNKIRTKTGFRVPFMFATGNKMFEKKTKIGG